ncbi:DUF6867 family protein [Arenibaculum pallidiluteum]|uniref:DUF6867 family protein n=1 Tax=Arenibaculum pallidiluteum TaxID=2812559 RepID=UPI001A95D1E3|nr:hypothetical protein [Arenibaculum pallidiluteum]
MGGFLSEGFGVFLGMTLLVSGPAAFLTGQNQAESWAPWWKVALYVLLLLVGQRFLAWALFHAAPGHPGSILANGAVLMAIALAAWRATMARRMVRQYPWLYERTGPFSWREKSPA